MNSSRKGGASRRQPPGSVRIIAGAWRGRRLRIATPGIRPTPDRVRETLFNWLAPWLPGRRCLDLYAGTGVLGIEALSRGARSCDFVERDPGAAAAIAGVLELLDAPAGEVVNADAWAWLGRPPRAAYQLVFVDPPYGEQDLAAHCARLAQGWVAPDAILYLETARRAVLPPLPQGWTPWREQVAGEVRFGLVRAAPAISPV
jgi:16S rRNA (guanine966-N2)-methyltransferase